MSTVSIEHLSKNESSFFKKIYISNGILRLDLLSQKHLKTATSYNTIESLIQKGLIYATRVEKTAGLGRPPETLWVNSGGARLFGVFLTSFEYRFAMLDFSGGLLCERKFRSNPERTTDDFLEDCTRSYREMLAQLALEDEDILGVAVSAIGPLNPVTGALPEVTFNARHRSWQGFPIRTELERRLGKQVVVDTNANACAYGLHILRYAQEYSDLAFFMINEGIGTGVIINSKPLNGGRDPSAGISHMIVGPGATRCYYGHYGCLCTRVGTEYLRDSVVGQIKLGKRSALSGTDAEDITFGDICSCAENGDPYCAGVIEDAALSFCIGINNFLTVLNVPLVILGGTFIEHSNLFFDTVKRGMLSYAPSLRVEKNTDYVQYALRGMAAKLVFAIIDGPQSPEKSPPSAKRKPARKA